MQHTCHYSLLGIPSDASAEQITAAYARALARIRRRLADGNPLPPEHLDAVRAAHRTLAAPATRSAYDASLTVAANIAATDKIGSRDEAAVEFRGQGHEYLRIWLVNVALTILTFGIYSAWAKVRREKYFHRNFVVDGATFDYHGNPRAILAGRIALMALIGVASFAENFGRAANLVASFACMLAFPWLLVRSMQFRARNTSYRGIRFNFSGTYGEAVRLYLLHGGLTAITLGLYFPAFLRRQKAFAVNNLGFGNMRCRFDTGVGAFYRGLAVPLALWLVLLCASMAIFVSAAAGLGKAGLGVMFIFLGPALVVLLTVLVNLVVVPYARVVGTNLLWNGMRLGEVSFSSTQRVRSYLGISLSNWMLTLLTLGFFWPLAQIRMARYRARNLAIVGPKALDNILGQEHPAPVALGDEAIHAFNLEIAL